MKGIREDHNMSDENQISRLRKKRTILGDISNNTSALRNALPDSIEKPTKNSKRLRTNYDDGDDDEPSSIAALLLQSPPVISQYASVIRKNHSTDRESTQETPPVHSIKRSLPLHVRSSEPGHCLEIIDRMYNVYYEIEDQFSAKPYLSLQKDINQKMRSILVDWLVEVHNKFKLQPQTLWLSVNILDRYLEKVQILRSRLQLVGVAALLIASKHEEIYPPEVKDCVYITDYAYSREEVVVMETAVLTTLEYKISIPTGYHFLCRYLCCIQASERTRHLASYYAERNLQESDMLCVQPHKFAAASVYAALKQQCVDCDTPTWTTVLREESGFSESDLVACARNVIDHVREEPQTASRRRLVATKNKYSSKSYSETSALPLPYI